MPTCHTGTARPCGHQFDQLVRIEAVSPAFRVTTGHPAGFGWVLACHIGGVGMNVTPDVIGCEFSSSVIVGLP